MTDFSKNVDQATAACERFESMAPAQRGYHRINLLMDLTAADGVNGNDQLDWDRLLAADDFNFLHDVCGISRHMNRETGEIGGHFLPRMRLRVHVAA